MTTPDATTSDEPADVIVHVFGRTDVGRVREHNEDAFLVADLTTDNASLQPEVRTHLLGSRGTLFMVADGLGGAAAGEIASEMAISTVHQQMHAQWSANERKDPESFARALKMAVEAANSKIFAYAIEHPEHRGLGTTATVAGLLGDTLYLVQVGDSRAYLVRDGVAQQITKDQSLMQRLVEAGELTPEEAERSERRNIILQALGPEPAVRIDLTYQQVRRGDTLVLCTDGLSGLVRRDEIAEVVGSTDDLTAVCAELIDRANENGGPDNITVIAARFDGNGLTPPEAEDRVGHAVFPLPGMQTPTSPHGPYGDDRIITSPHAAIPANGSGVGPSNDGSMGRGDPASRAIFIALATAILVLAIFLAAREWRGAVQHDTPSGGTDSTAVIPAGQP